MLRERRHIWSSMPSKRVFASSVADIGIVAALVLYAVRSLRHFAPTFRAGRMLLFIHWRRRRRAPTAHGRSADRPARASCWPTSRILFRDKAGARAIGPHAADVGWRRRDASYGVIDIGPVDTAWAEGLFTSCSRIDISGWRDHGLYPLVQGRRGARGESTERA